MSKASADYKWKKGGERPCERCGQMRAASSFLKRGRTCRGCRKSGGPLPPTRRCSVCHNTKPLTEEFFQWVPSKTRFTSMCRACKRVEVNTRYHYREDVRVKARARAKAHRAKINKRRAEDPEFDAEVREKLRGYSETARKRRAQPKRGKKRGSAPRVPVAPIAVVVDRERKARGISWAELASAAGRRKSETSWVQRRLGLMEWSGYGRPEGGWATEIDVDLATIFVTAVGLDPVDVEGI